MVVSALRGLTAQCSSAANFSALQMMELKSFSVPLALHVPSSMFLVVPKSKELTIYNRLRTTYLLISEEARRAWSSIFNTVGTDDVAPTTRWTWL